MIISFFHGSFFSILVLRIFHLPKYPNAYPIFYSH